MGQIWEKHIHDKLKELDKFILPKYREESKKRIEEQEIGYALYEKDFKKRIKSAIKTLTPITNEATNGLVFYREKGARPLLKPNEKLRLILIHQLFGKSNRNMSYMLMLFSLMTGIDVSYKYVERLYSDPETEAALFNLLILLLKKKKINKIDCCGDGTGYSLMISKHYLSGVNKLKDKVKEQIEDVKKVNEEWVVTGNSGIVLDICGSGSTMKQAQNQVYNRIKEITIPHMYHRDDIGERWFEDSDKLHNWGYLREV